MYEKTIELLEKAAKQMGLSYLIKDCPCEKGMESYFFITHQDCSVGVRVSQIDPRGMDLEDMKSLIVESLRRATDNLMLSASNWRDTYHLNYVARNKNMVYPEHLKDIQFESAETHDLIGFWVMENEDYCIKLTTQMEQQLNLGQSDYDEARKNMIQSVKIDCPKVHEANIYRTDGELECSGLILIKEIQDMILEKVGECYIIPASKRMYMAFSYKPKINKDWMNLAVTFANMELDEKEILSNHVYILTKNGLSQ